MIAVLGFLEPCRRLGQETAGQDVALSGQVALQVQTGRARLRAEGRGAGPRVFGDGVGGTR